MKFKKTISALLSLAMSAGLTANVLSTSYLNVNAETTTAKTDFLLGDVNGNGMVDAVDASSVLTYYAKTSTGKDGGFTEIQMKAADMNENGLVDATDASAILTFYAKSSVDNGGASGTVELSNFKASVWDIYINTEETVKFTVDVTADEKLAEKELALYDDSDNLVAYMNDDGKNGDEKANDGVYSVDVELSSAETEIVNYYASNGKEKSNTRKISFYRNLTTDDLKGFYNIISTITPMSFEDACEYIKNSDEIKTYDIDEKSQTIGYKSIYGFSSIWEPISDSEDRKYLCGTGAIAIPDEKMITDEYAPYGYIPSDIYDQAMLKIRGYGTHPVDHKNNNVALLDQAKVTGNCSKMANLIVQAVNSQSSETEEEIRNSHLYVMDGDEINTYEALKHLEDYSTVIFDAHGTGLTNNAEYIMTGTTLNFGEAINLLNTIMYPVIDPIKKDFVFNDDVSRDVFADNIIVAPPQDTEDFSDITYKWEISVGSGFFDKYYSEGDLNGSIWILGDCRSMAHDDIADVLLSKGAETVVGYSDIVWSIYRDNTMFEMLINSMILSGDTIGNGIEEAKRIFGETDPFKEVKHLNTHIRIKGNRDYRYIAEADTAKIVTSLPITTTTTVPVATAPTITTTKAASEMPPDIFGEKVYSMPGNISISFSPIDAGTNRDPRTLDIITKLYNELDDSDKATYHSYTGPVTFSFSPKYTTDKGVEVGEYSSLGDILNCARSIDDTFSFFMSNLEEGEDSSKTAWVECYNNDFDALSGKLIHREYSTREEKIYEYAKKDNEKFNMYSAIFGNRSFLCEGRNDTIITIVKDDYYYYKWNSFTGVLTKYSARMWYNNYFVNHEKDYGGTMVHYVIDLRPKYDAALRDMCGESGGKYIQYSEENLDNLIKLINARRAYIDEYSRIQSEK